MAMKMTPIARLLMLAIRAYQWFSRFTPRHCRFYPTCSQYALTALERHGFRKGSNLAIRRILRCNPWNPGGYDPVPQRRMS